MTQVPPITPTRFPKQKPPKINEKRKGEMVVNS
jgi:hypothetical protein